MGKDGHNLPSYLGGDGHLSNVLLGRGGHQSTLLFGRGWASVYLFILKGWPPISFSIWEGMGIDLRFYFEVVQTNLFFYLGGDGHVSTFLFERGRLLIYLNGDDSLLVFNKGVGTYSSIWERMATNLPSHLGGDEHF